MGLTYDACACRSYSHQPSGEAKTGTNFELDSLHDVHLNNFVTQIIHLQQPLRERIFVFRVL